MNRFCKRFFWVILGVLTSLPAWAAPTADALLDQVRFSATQNQNLLLRGKLRPSVGDRVPFQLHMQGEEIRFDFLNAQNQPQRSLALRLKENKGELFESLAGGQFKAVAPQAAAAPIGQTDVNYADIAFSYLYWPNPQFLGEGRVGDLLTWRVRVTNPKAAGPYAVMDLDIEQKTGALVQMNGFDRQGKRIKNMVVKDYAKVQGAWMVTKLQVETRDPANGAVKSRTYLEISKK